MTGALLCTLALGGCKVGPNYRAPAVPAPPAYSDNGHNGDWAAAKPADSVDRGDWWAIYQDAELNDLEAALCDVRIRISRRRCMRTSRRTTWCARIEPRCTRRSRSARGRAATASPTPRRCGHAGSAADYWEFLIPLNISWEPDLWGGIRRQIESSAANAQASAADLANTRLSLQGMLAVTYFQLRGLDLQAQLLRSTLDTYTQTLQLTREPLQGRSGTESDVQQAQAQLEETRAQLIDLGVQRAQYEHAIAVLVGVPATGFPHCGEAAGGRPAQRSHGHSVGAAAAAAGYRGRGAAGCVGRMR